MTSCTETLMIAELLVRGNMKLAPPQANPRLPACGKERAADAHPNQGTGAVGLPQSHLMATDNESLIAQLWLDPLRHITPLKMVALVRRRHAGAATGPAHGTANVGGLLPVSPRAISQYDQMNYGDVDCCHTGATGNCGRRNH